LVNLGQKISFRSIPKTPPLFVDYLERGSASKRFFPHHFLDPGSFQRVARELPFDDSHRKALVYALSRQNEQWGMSEKTRRNLKTLSEAGCYAVVTGQQVGLLTGPCYNIYKALTIIRLAQHLTEQGIPSVPVFWMETTDHDLEEVDHVVLLDRASQSLCPITMVFDPLNDGRPVGDIVLGPGLSEFQETLRNQLPVNSGFSDQVLDLVRQCYREGRTLGGAFASMMERLLGEYGLILMDPLDPTLAALSGPVFKWALAQSKALQARMAQANDEITRAGFEPQIKPDPQSTFVFYADEGKRRLLLQEGNQVWPKGSDRRMSLEEAHALADAQPEKFSASVALRPLLQDHLLPTIAFVGGPSETSYWAQLEGFYQLWGRPMPVVVPRASFTVSTEKAQRILVKYGLEFSSVFGGVEKLTAEVFERSVTAVASAQFDHLMAGVNEGLSRLRPALEGTDTTLAGAIETARQKIEYQVSHLKGKYLRAEERRNEMIVQQIVALENLLWPRKNLQERELNVCYFLGRYGRGFLQTIFEATEPMPSSHVLLTIESEGSGESSQD
jgi:bacillithiol biosynthesis cysteine-adding enzyme BshC